MQSEYRVIANLPWYHRIEWLDFFYNLLVLGLLIATLTLSAITFSQVEEATTCRLRYEGNENDVSERQLQTLAKEVGWTLTHPQSPDCNRCQQNDHFPVWMAPVDICTRFELPETHPLCNGNMNLDISHVKVCATQTQIDEAWANGGCQLHNGNQTTPHVAWDGTLFCATSATTCSYESYWNNYETAYLENDKTCSVQTSHNKEYFFEDGTAIIEVDVSFVKYFYQLGCSSNKDSKLGAYLAVHDLKDGFEFHCVKIDAYQKGTVDTFSAGVETESNGKTFGQWFYPMTDSGFPYSDVSSPKILHGGNPIDSWKKTNDLPTFEKRCRGSDKMEIDENYHVHIGTHKVYILRVRCRN